MAKYRSLTFLTYLTFAVSRPVQKDPHSIGLPDHLTSPSLLTHLSFTAYLNDSFIRFIIVPSSSKNFFSISSVLQTNRKCIGLFFISQNNIKTNNNTKPSQPRPFEQSYNHSRLFETRSTIYQSAIRPSDVSSLSLSANSINTTSSTGPPNFSPHPHTHTLTHLSDQHFNHCQ